MTDDAKNRSENLADSNELWRGRLRLAIKARGLDFDELSEASGNSPQYLSKVLKGRFNPTVQRLQKVCDTAGIDIAYLFSADGDQVSTAALISKAADLSEAEGELVRRLLESAKPSR